MESRVIELRKSGVPFFLVALLVNGKAVKYTTTMGLAGANTWLLANGGKPV